ncbi:MAG: coenzyme F420 hydrogenase/dehydrogenase beta subunit N-terminal domain-containing protein, partial [candidate division NC10 bacterium]|nr:coenzyme F420 hydrogenase/dehydrogenase beta subunit N-terminal domain-containing protein [candidate division NC10 bacterium]
MSNSFLDTVVDGGYCVGCGVCAAIGRSFLRMRLDGLGLFKPERSNAPLPEGVVADLPALCPFSDRCLDEDQIGTQLYKGLGEFDRNLGYHCSVYAGFVAEGDFRQRGSSGGLGKWILCKLLETGMVDAVVQVVPSVPSESEGLLFRYQVTASIDETKNGAKSAYYPVEMSQVLQFIKDQPAVYAIVGLPCFMKGIRLLSSRSPVFKERVRFCIGLVCGHLKSARYADMLAWQLGIC